MSEVRYRCPDSGEEVVTSIKTGADVLRRMRSMNLSFSAWCPHCMSAHQIKAADARLQDNLLAGEPQDGEAQLAEPAQLAVG
jgi:hypothetical protein